MVFLFAILTLKCINRIIQNLFLFLNFNYFLILSNILLLLTASNSLKFIFILKSPITHTHTVRMSSLNFLDGSFVWALTHAMQWHQIRHWFTFQVSSIEWTLHNQVFVIPLQIFLGFPLFYNRVKNFKFFFFLLCHLIKHSICHTR